MKIIGTISSTQNKLITETAKLSDKKYRQQSRLYVIEGEKMVFEALQRGVEIKHLFFDEKFAEKLAKFDVEGYCVSSAVLEKICDTKTPQGIAATVKMPDVQPKSPAGSCLILDGISDSGNLGTIIRSAAACNIRDIYLVGCADIYSPKTVRSTMSTIFSVRCYEVDAEQVLRMVSGHELICADMGGCNIFDYKKTKDYALVVGNESRGVSDFFKEKCNTILKLPMESDVESLNAAVCASVFMYILNNIAN